MQKIYLQIPIFAVITIVSNANFPKRSAVETFIESTDHFVNDSSFGCAQITPNVIEAAIASSNGSKANYFRYLQKFTPLSRGGSTLSMNKMRSNYARHIHSMRGYNSGILFIGDSIVREISESFARISPGSPYRYEEVNKWKWAPGFNIQAGLEAHIRDTRHGGPFKTVFVGGLGLHFLYRNGNELIVDPKSSPVELHRFLVRTYLAAWAELSSKLSTQLIFVGTIPLEDALLHLHPPKGDWAAFYHFSLAKIWAGIDGVEYLRLVDSWSSDMKLNPPLHFFDPARLAQRCGAIRCDGMHFSSHFPKEFGCYSSAFLWDAEIADFLVRRLPDTWRRI